MPGTNWRSSAIARHKDVHCWLVQRRTCRVFVPSHDFGSCQQVPLTSVTLHTVACSKSQTASPVHPVLRVHVVPVAPQAPVAAVFTPRAPAIVPFQYVTWSQPQTGSRLLFGSGRAVQIPVSPHASVLQYSLGKHEPGALVLHFTEPGGPASIGFPLDDEVVPQSRQPLAPLVPVPDVPDVPDAPDAPELPPEVPDVAFPEVEPELAAALFGTSSKRFVSAAPPHAARIPKNTTKEATTRIA